MGCEMQEGEACWHLWQLLVKPGGCVRTHTYAHTYVHTQMQGPCSRLGANASEQLRASVERSDPTTTLVSRERQKDNIRGVEGSFSSQFFFFCKDLMSRTIKSKPQVFSWNREIICTVWLSGDKKEVHEKKYGDSFKPSLSSKFFNVS